MAFFDYLNNYSEKKNKKVIKESIDLNKEKFINQHKLKHLSHNMYQAPNGQEYEWQEDKGKFFNLELSSDIIKYRKNKAEEKVKKESIKEEAVQQKKFQSITEHVNHILDGVKFDQKQTQLSDGSSIDHINSILG